MESKIDQNKCVGCGICANICLDGIEMINGKAKIKNKNANCLRSAANACPMKAILLDKEEIETEKNNINQNISSEQFDRGMGMGRGRSPRRGLRNGRGHGYGIGKGMGRNRKSW